MQRLRRAGRGFVETALPRQAEQRERNARAHGVRGDRGDRGAMGIILHREYCTSIVARERSHWV